MVEEEGFDLEKSAQRAGRGVVLGALQAIGDWLRGRKNPSEAERPARGVLILGSGGTGKSTFGRLLSGQPDWLNDDPGEYAESPDLERFALADDPSVELIVAPGQEYRRAATWPELLGQVGAGHYRGVVLVNAYGYHTFGTPSYKDHKLFTKDKETFRADYLADRRTEELRVLQQLVPHLSICPRKVWVLSLVVKQDLWGSKQGVVEQHYRDGDYEKHLQTVTSALGNRLFRRETVFVALTIRSLMTLAGETLWPNESGYDMPRLADSLRRLVATFTALRAWEDET